MVCYVIVVEERRLTPRKLDMSGVGKLPIEKAAYTKRGLGETHTDDPSNRANKGKR